APAICPLTAETIYFSISLIILVRLEDDSIQLKISSKLCKDSIVFISPPAQKESPELERIIIFTFGLLSAFIKFPISHSDSFGDRSFNFLGLFITICAISVSSKYLVK